MGLLLYVSIVVGILHKLSSLVLKNLPKLSYLYIMETVTQSFRNFPRSRKW